MQHCRLEAKSVLLLCRKTGNFRQSRLLAIINQGRRVEKNCTERKYFYFLSFDLFSCETGDLTERERGVFKLDLNGGTIFVDALRNIKTSKEIVCFSMHTYLA